MSGWQAVRIDDLDAIPWPGAETTWRPLRAAIGARIAGMGAYTAERAGQDVVEPHRESAGGMGHQEVYIVLRGRATFTLDGTELDAPAGTVVRVDPDVHRAGARDRRRAARRAAGRAGPADRRGAPRRRPRRPRGRDRRTRRGQRGVSRGVTRRP